jgi:hypothetical protein
LRPHRANCSRPSCRRDPRPAPVPPAPRGATPLWRSHRNPGSNWLYIRCQLDTSEKDCARQGPSAVVHAVVIESAPGQTDQDFLIRRDDSPPAPVQVGAAAYSFGIMSREANCRPRIATASTGTATRRPRNPSTPVWATISRIRASGVRTTWRTMPIVTSL